MSHPPRRPLETFASHFSGSRKESRVPEQQRRTSHAESFPKRKQTLTHQLFSPRQQLVVKRNLDRTHVTARTAQAARVRQTLITLCISGGRQNGADRPRNGRVVTVASTASINWTRIHASTATNAVQCIPKFFTASQTTASVIHQDNVQFAFRVTRSMKV